MGRLTGMRIRLRSKRSEIHSVTIKDADQRISNSWAGLLEVRFAAEIRQADAELRMIRRANATRSPPEDARLQRVGPSMSASGFCDVGVRLEPRPGGANENGRSPAQSDPSTCPQSAMNRSPATIGDDGSRDRADAGSRRGCPSTCSPSVVSASSTATGTRPSRHAKSTPDLGRILTVDLDGAVSGRAALTQSLGGQAVAGRARVDDHSLSAQRPLERQRVGVRMPGLVVRADTGHIDQHHAVASLHPYVAAVGQVDQAVRSVRPRPAGPVAARIVPGRPVRSQFPGRRR